ncbi:hypothetical protein Tco_0226907 [Tanacetum coccineum]
MLTSEIALSCEPMVSSLNNDEINFRISFDESDDEDCTPKISYFDDLDFFNDFENEFPAIVYNDALTSKLDFLTEPIVSPQHIDEFNLKDETSLSECDEEEQNVLNFNDLFPFNVIYPNDSKSDKDNDDDKVDIEHSSGDLSVKPLPDVKMDNPNITMEEYIRLEEEKAHRHGKVYNWKTATYDKIWDNEDVHDLRSVETEFPAIVFNDTLTSEALLCEPTISSLNDEIDFRILFDESDDEDCKTVNLQKSFLLYKINYVNDINKRDSEKDNDTVHYPVCYPSPSPRSFILMINTTFKDFEK